MNTFDWVVVIGIGVGAVLYWLLSIWAKSMSDEP
jgi:hypothetical protein